MAILNQHGRHDMTEAITISVRLKRNLGNYESLDIEGSYSGPLLENENPREAFSRIYEFVTDEVSARTNEAVRQLRG